MIVLKLCERTVTMARLSRPLDYGYIQKRGTEYLIEVPEFH